MQDSDGLERVGEVPTTPTVIAKDAPDLEARKGVLDASPTATMPTPSRIANDPVATKHRGDELGYAAIAAVGEDPAMASAERLDHGPAVVNRVVPVAGPAGGGRDDAEVASPDEDLRIA